MTTNNLKTILANLEYCEVWEDSFGDLFDCPEDTNGIHISRGNQYVIRDVDGTIIDAVETKEDIDESYFERKRYHFWYRDNQDNWDFDTYAMTLIEALTLARKTWKYRRISDAD